MLKILDFNYNFVGATDEYLNPKRVSMLEKGDKELSFVIPSGLGINELIKEQYFVEFENDRYCIKEKKENIEGIGYICQLDIEGLLGEVYELIVGVNDDIPTLFERIDVSKSGWKIECDPKFTKRRTINLEYFDLWNLITEVIKVYTCEIKIDSINRIVYFTESVGNDNDVYFTEGLNIDESGIEIVSDSYELYTRIIPLGVGKVDISTVNDGKTYIDNFQYMDKIKTFYWKDERYTDLEQLKEDATIRLDQLSKPRNTINVTLKNLANISGEFEWLRVNVGDTITILSKGIKEKYRISELTEHPHSPFNDSITLANTNANLSSYLQDRENDISKLDLSFEKISVTTGEISSKVQKVEYDIEQHETRINSAEEKITPDAIVHVVSESQTNGESTFAKTSEMKQTIDGFEFKVGQSGKTNLIRNSLGKNSDKNWTWFNFKGDTLTHTIGCQNDEWTNYEDALTINVLEINYDVDQGYVQKIPISPGKKYVFRAMVGGHRSAKRIGFTNEGDTQFITDVWTGGHMDGFTEIVLKFTATEKYCNLRLGFNGSNNNGILWLKEAMLIEGELPSKWQAHESELYEGITTIDKDGVEVAHSNGYKSRLSSESLQFLNNNGNEAMAVVRGGIEFADENNNEKIGFMKNSVLGQTGLNGITLGVSSVGDYITLGRFEGTDYNSWSVTPMFRCIPRSNSQLCNGFAGLYFHSKAMADNGIAFTSENNDTPHLIQGITGGNLGVYGDNGVNLGCKEGTSLISRLKYLEAETKWHNYANWDFHNWTMWNMVTANTLTSPTARTSVITRGMEAERREVRFIFTDMQISNGKAIINIPNRYLTHMSAYTIVSLVKKGKGDIWISEEYENYFVIEADQEIKFNCEIAITLADSISLMSFEKEEAIIDKAMTKEVKADSSFVFADSEENK